MDRINMTEEKQEVGIEDIIRSYEQRLAEQTNIIFAIVAQQGGSITIKQEDFDRMDDKNTVSANLNEDGSLKIELTYEERPEGIVGGKN